MNRNPIPSSCRDTGSWDRNGSRRYGRPRPQDPAGLRVRSSERGLRVTGFLRLCGLAGAIALAGAASGVSAEGGVTAQIDPRTGLLDAPLTVRFQGTRPRNPVVLRLRLTSRDGVRWQASLTARSDARQSAARRLVMLRAAAVGSGSRLEPVDAAPSGTTHALRVDGRERAARGHRRGEAPLTAKDISRSNSTGEAGHRGR